LSKFWRRLLIVTGAAAGFVVTFYCINPLEALLGRDLTLAQSISLVAFGMAVGGVFGFSTAPWLALRAWQFAQWLEGRVSRTPVADIVAGVVGLIIGLIISSLIASPLSHIPWIGGFLPATVMVLLAYLGLSVGLKKREELKSLFSLLRPGMVRERPPRAAHQAARPKVLDTSVIIDGRVADICEAGFLEGELVIADFVLEELRHIADSSDVLKRNRGRRGLDVLNKIQKEIQVPVRIYEADGGENGEVDTRLVKLAQELGGQILTNDFNLNKVAQLHGVPVLNINELANALKPVVLPGEDMQVHVIRDGKESGQGVAYLDDGTMIVVDGGKKHIGEVIDVSVTSVLQTAAGRMIFARPRAGSQKALS